MPSNYTAVPLDEPTSLPSRSPRLSSADGLPLPVTAGAPSFNSSSSAAAAAAAAPSYPPPPSRRTLKGKSKALGQSSPNDEESRLEGAAEAEGPAGMSFAIRFTDGSEDLLDFWCGSQESVGEVKRRVSYSRCRVDPLVRLAPRADRGPLCSLYYNSSASYDHHSTSTTGHGGCD
jgi:hypothetical protein